jgi:uncharacterized repeat protein (TIGR01451 family)
MGTKALTSTSTYTRTPARLLFTLLVALSLVATNLAGFGALSGWADEPPYPWDGSDGSPDQTDSSIHLEDECNSRTDDQPRNGNNYKLNNIQDAGTPVFTTGNVSGKGDICDVYLDLTSDGDDVYLYFGWSRYSSEGAVNISLELQKGELAPSCEGDNPDFFGAGGCNPFANRQDGDLLLTFDFDPVPVIYTQVWQAGAWSPEAELDTDQVPEISLDNPAKNATLFGEAVINLTEAGVLPSSGDECVTFATVLPFSQTGNSPTAELFDVVLQGFPGPRITNCGLLYVEKVTVPDNIPGAFDVTLYGGPKGYTVQNSPYTTTLIDHGGKETFQDLLAGSTYRLDEDVPPGWDLTSISCTLNGSPAQDGAGNITIQAAKTTNCIVTNEARLPKVTLNKTVVNSWGGTATAADFTPRFAGQDRAWGQEFTVSPGSYTASELAKTTNDAGKYLADAWAGSCSANGALTVSLGGTYTCSITNRDQPAKLVLEKTVVNNHGGTKTKGDFTPRIDGDVKAWDTTYDLAAGSYAISEDAVAGYAAGDWGGACSPDGSLQLAIGQSATCTITNIDVAPGLTVLKNVQNQHGGDAKPEDFQLYISHEEAVDEPITEAEPPEAALMTVTTEPEGEEDELDEAPGPGSTEPEPLEEEELLVTDDATALGAPAMTTVTETRSIKHGDSPTVEAYVEYTLSEDLLPGYELVGIACVDNETKASVSHPVALTEGQSVTCTITNRDEQPTLTVTKVVTNDDGGELGVTEFPLTYNGVSATSGVSNNVLANQSYTVTEEQQDGYELTRIDCGGKGATTEADSFDVTLAPGEHVTCTLSNDDIAPEITVVKEVIGGSAAPDDFALTLNGEPVLSGSTTKVTAGETYTVGETSIANYRQTGLSCVETGTTTTVTHPVVPALAQSITCTITNTFTPPPPPPPPPGVPGISLEKQVSVAGGPWLDADTAPGPVAQVGQNVRFRFIVSNTGATTLTGFTLTDNVYSTAGCALPASLAPGATASCTIGPLAATAGQHTNIGTVTSSGLTATDPANYFGEGPGIQVVKTADTDEAQVGDVVTYTYVVTNIGNVTLTGVMLEDDIIGVIDLPAEGLTLDPGESVTVTATYTITEDDAAVGSVTNIATASGQPPTGQRVSDTDDATVDVPAVLPIVLEPGVSIVKAATGGVTEDDDGNLVANVDDVVTYTYVITNTGDEALGDLTLVDDKIGDLTDALRSELLAAIGDLEFPVGESVTVTAGYRPTAADAANGSVTNIAIVSAVGVESGVEVDADDSETVDVAEVLDVVISQPAPALPRTGADAHLLFTLGLLMAAMGAAVLLFAPRRRRSER